MQRTGITLLIFAAMLLAHVQPFFGLLIDNATAEGVFKYTDRDGKTHYITDPEKVPEEYRSQVSTKAALPEISKTESTTPSGTASSPGRGMSSQGRRESVKSPALYPSSKVEIFVTAWCPYCRSLEELLKERRVRYQSYDIEKSAKGKQLHESLGGGGVPVIRIGKEVIRGYDPDRILAALKRR